MLDLGEFYRFFDSTIDDKRYYTADEFAEYFRSMLTSGILNGGTNLQVNSLGTDMNINIQDGYAFINGYLYKVEGGHELVVDTPNPSLPRIDRVVLRWDVSEENRYIKAFVLPGTPKASPVPPDITREGNVFELSLAQIYVEAGKSFITESAITDERFNSAVCGLSNSLITVDTSEVFTQFTAWFKEHSTDYANQWETWFANQQTEGYVMATDLLDIRTEFANKIQHAENTSVDMRSLSVQKSGKDDDGTFTTVIYSRKSDGSLYCISQLGGKAPSYSVRTETYFDVSGEATHTNEYKLTYDADEVLIGEI